VARLRSDFFVSAYLRRCAIEGIDAVLRRRGAAEAGAIFVKVDHRNGTASLYGPAPQALIGEESGERLFGRILAAVPPGEVEERMRREIRFDPDLFLLEIDEPGDRHLLPIAPEGE
jgi:hypothetical protein